VNDDSTAWQRLYRDPWVTRPLVPLGTSWHPAGGDLSLRVGWDAFERLIVAIAPDFFALRGVAFRRYGRQGQQQHGIDLAGADESGSYVVVQCKEYEAFSPSDLRLAVETFATGKRPFDATRFVVAVSLPLQDTHVEDELGRCRRDHPDLTIDLWGAEQINDVLRHRADVVARFWSRATAEEFCTASPLPGVPAPPLDRARQAEQILLGPLQLDGLYQLNDEAGSATLSDPARAATLYGELSERLVAEGFPAHAHVIRRKQLEALSAAEDYGGAATLAAKLAVTALVEADAYHARMFFHQLQELWQKSAGDGTVNASLRVVGAAYLSLSHPIGDLTALRDLLQASDVENPELRMNLILLLGEATLAENCLYSTGVDAHELSASLKPCGGLSDMAALFSEELTRLRDYPARSPQGDIRLRLRLLVAEYSLEERRALLREARSRLLSGAQCALVLARQARREAEAGLADEALENWRSAIGNAIHAGLLRDASDWLYCIRSLNVLYGPWTENLEDEHRLAQSLRTTEGGYVLVRSTQPRELAFRAAASGNDAEAVGHARQWLSDSRVTGAWTSELEACELLGDLYARNQEGALAARYYQISGRGKKLETLAEQADRVLPIGVLNGPWWERESQIEQVIAQADLLPDDVAARLLRELILLARLCRTGEAMDGPLGNLTVASVSGACVLAARGSLDNAREVLLLGDPGSAWPQNALGRADNKHSAACLDIALSFPSLRFEAIKQLLDLADLDLHWSLEVVSSQRFADAVVGTTSDSSPVVPALPDDQLRAVRARIAQMQSAGRYRASIAHALIAPEEMGSEDVAQARAALQRILAHKPPDETSVSIWGSRCL
jgi:hypothetical protein